MNPGPCEVCGQAKRLLFTNYACFNERCGQPEDQEVRFTSGAEYLLDHSTWTIPANAKPCGLCGDRDCPIWVDPDSPQAKAYADAVAAVVQVKVDVPTFWKAKFDETERWMAELERKFDEYYLKRGLK